MKLILIIVLFFSAFVKAQEEGRSISKETAQSIIEELAASEQKKERLINSLKEALKKSFAEFVASGQSKGLTALEVAQGALESEELLDVLEKDINRQIIRTLKFAPVGLTALEAAQRLGNKEILDVLENENKKAKALQNQYDLTVLDLVQRLGNKEILDVLENENKKAKALQNQYDLTVLDLVQIWGNKEILDVLENENKKAKALQNQYDLTVLDLAQSLEKLNIRALLKEAIDRAAVELLDGKPSASGRKCALKF